MSLSDVLIARGAVFADANGLKMPRHFGDPAAEYVAATTGAGLVLRRDRALLRVYGRAPVQMLQGILTNSVTDPPNQGPDGSLVSAVHYAAILTPKGKMVTDLKQLWLAQDEEGGIGLDVPAAGREGALAYFARVLPPRFAVVEDLTDEIVTLTVVGPRAEACLAGLVSSLPAQGSTLLDGGALSGGVLVARGLEQVPSWDLRVPTARAVEFWEALERGGAVPVGWGVWETLRVEAGFPQFGVDMTDATIPIEAGIGERAFDHAKGCYTGQEVIIRIRHRGRVNWHLRALRFGEISPGIGDQLFEAQSERAVGRVTSSVESPAFGQVVGMGYVRREVELPARLRLGDGEGPEVAVARLPTEADG